MNGWFNKRHGLLFLCVIFLTGCWDNSPSLVLGTLERDRITLRATAPETITHIAVQQGTGVSAGELLLQLDNRKQRSLVTKAHADVMQARAYLSELENGARPEEIAAAKAQVSSLQAQVTEAEKNHNRTRSLVAKNMLREADLDTTRARRDSLTSDLKNVQEKLLVLTNGTRPETLQQASAALNRTKAALLLEQQKLDELSIKAPVSGVLDSLPKKTGERVMTGDPVAILLAEGAPYARVYIPESLRAGIKIGDLFSVHIDGVDQSYTGSVRWLALDPAFTPHYALNEKERSRLVYMAEIELPDTAFAIPAGIPVQVELPL